jgi:hypothetical protein
MEKNKTGKYFKYAIGEIILVVIGILIALSINNWNESNKENQIEHKYLKNILSDLIDQDTSIDIQLGFEETFFRSSNYIIKDYQQNSTLVIDSTFFKHATMLTSRKTFVLTDPTYTDLISSGNINIIKNIEFKDKLIKFYQELERIEKIIQNNNSLLIDQNYLSTYIKSGYYYEPNIQTILRGFNNFNERSINQKYKIELQEISKKSLLKDENKLAFMNALYLRNTIAIGNFDMLKEIQFTTQSLINELEKLYND